MVTEESGDARAILTDAPRGDRHWIPHSRPTVGRAELEQLGAVLDSQYLANGLRTKDFEHSLGRFLGQRHARAVTSGTCALQLALMSLAPSESLKDLGTLCEFFRGRKVLIPAYVCSAVLYAVEWTGAAPVLVDVDEENWCADPERMTELAGPETLAAVVAYLFGHPGKKNLPETVELAWVEDIAQAIGARRGGVPVGSQGHSAVCSFYATKVITTGSGGMVLTRDEEAGKRIARLLQYDNQPDSLLHLSWDMSDVQAALGLAQWNRLEKTVQRRRQIAEIYTRALAGQALLEALPTTGPNRDRLIEGHIYYRYPVRLRRGLESFIEGMNQAGIEAKRPVFAPLYRLRGEDPARFPVTEKLFQSTVSLPLYPDLSDSDAERIAQATRQVLATL